MVPRKGATDMRKIHWNVDPNANIITLVGLSGHTFKGIGSNLDYYIIEVRDCQ